MTPNKFKTDGHLPESPMDQNVLIGSLKGEARLYFCSAILSTVFSADIWTIRKSDLATQQQLAYLFFILFITSNNHFSM